MLSRVIDFTRTALILIAKPNHPDPEGEREMWKDRLRNALLHFVQPDMDFVVDTAEGFMICFAKHKDDGEVWVQVAGDPDRPDLWQSFDSFIGWYVENNRLDDPALLSGGV